MSSPDPKLVLSIAADIVATKERLAQLQGQWDSFFSSPDPAPSFALEPKAQEGAIKKRSRAQSLSGRIVSLVEADAQTHYDTPAIALALGESVDKVQKSINKLVYKKKIGRYARGLYQSVRAEHQYAN